MKLRTLPWMLLGALVLLVLLGPRPSRDHTLREPDLPAWTSGGMDDLLALERSLVEAEAGVEDLVPGAEVRIFWADPESPARTKYAVVYLHGFSATRQETSPLSDEVATALGANLFYARLTGHGRSGEAMAQGSVDAWLNDALAALEVGRRLGDRVVVIGTSTGGTLATWLGAAEDFGPAGESLDVKARAWGGPPSLAESLAALVLISPNFGPVDRSSRMLLWPWGGWLAQRVVGPERCFEPVNDLQAEFWTECYPTRALLPMMALVDLVNGMDLSRVRAPTLVVYSPHDEVVSPQLTMDALAKWGSSRTKLLPVDESGDPSNHVLAGAILSPETVDPIKGAIVEFLLELDPGS